MTTTPPSPDWNLVPVRDRLIQLDGKPASGTVVFEAVGASVFVSHEYLTTILGRPITVELDANGEYEVSLPATDDPDVVPNGFNYRVTERLNGGGGRPPFNLDVPLVDATEGITISEVLQVEPATNVPINIKEGDSAYVVAVNNGYSGTEAEWVASLKGENAYELAVLSGFSGTEAEWIASLEGTSAYEAAVAQGFVGTEAEWVDSLEGTSAYEAAVAQGYAGSEAEWVESLKGENAYQLAVLDGYTGTEAEWLDHLEGDSAYQIAVANGYVGTEAEWADFLKGETRYLVEQIDGTYPPFPEPTEAPVTFVGAADPTTLMRDGDSWLNTSENAAATHYLRTKDLPVLAENLVTNPSFEATDGTVVVQESLQGYGGTTPADNDASAPLIDLDYLGAQGYLELDSYAGSSSNYAATSDFVPTGDVDIRMQLSHDTWTVDGSAAETIFSQWTGVTRYILWLQGGGTLRVVANDADDVRHDSTIPFDLRTILSPGATAWLRVVIDVDNGQNQARYHLYTSTDGAAWTLRSSATAAAGAISAWPAGTSVPQIGVYNNSTNPFSGRIHRLQVRDGIDGILRADFNADDFEDGSTDGDTAYDSTGRTWTLNGPGTMIHTRKVAWLPGTSGNYISTPDKNELDYDSSTFENGVGRWEGLNKNLLTADESSFETSVAGWAGITSNPTRVTAQAFDGAASLKLTAVNAGGMNAISPRTANSPSVVPGQVYTAAAWVRADTTPRRVRMGIDWLDAAGTYLGTSTIDPQATDHAAGWTQVVETAQVPSDARRANLNIVFFDCVAGEVHYVDAVSLMETPNANLVNNPDFENNIEGWGTANTAPAISRSTEMAYTGVAGLKVEWQTAAAEQGDARCNVPTIVGETYTASAWVYVPAGGVDSGLRVAAGNSNTVTTRDTWVRATRTWVATATTTPIQLINHAASTSGQATYFDAVQVVKGSEALPYLPPSTTNLYTNPGVEDLSTYQPGTTVTLSSVEPNIVRVTTNSDPAINSSYLTTFGSNSPRVTGGQTLTFSYFVKSDAESARTKPFIQWMDGDLNAFSSTDGGYHTISSSGTKVAVTDVAPAGAVAARVVMYLKGAGTGEVAPPPNTDFDFYQLQAEFGSVATPYVDGSLGAGYSWDSSENLFTSDPDMELADTSAWTVANGAAIEKSTAEKWQGTQSMLVTLPTFAGQTGLSYPGLTNLIVAGHTYTASAWIKNVDAAGTASGNNPAGVFLDVQGLGVAGYSPSSQGVEAGSDWTRVSVTFTVPSSWDGTNANLYALVTNPTSGQTFYVDAVQIEQRPFATPYGQTGEGHASTSTRRTPWVLGGTVLDDIRHNVAGKHAQVYNNWRYAHWPFESLPLGAGLRATVKSGASYVWSMETLYGAGGMMRVRDMTSGAVLASRNLTRYTDFAVSDLAFATSVATTEVRLEFLSRSDQSYMETAAFRAVQLEESGATTDYVPPLRITGDIDIRAKVALEDWTPGTTTGLVSKGYGIGYWFTISVTGNLALTCVVDGSQYGRSSTVPVPSSNGEPYWVRVTRSTSLGEFRFYTSSDGAMWSQLGDTLVSNDAAMQHSNTPLVVGSSNQSHPLKGKVLNASVHAGIDGPVVAEFRPQEADAPGTTWTDSTGREWTINRSGDATAEIVDRNTWAFTGSEYLNFDPSAQAAFDNAREEATVVLSEQSRSVSATNILFHSSLAGADGFGGNEEFHINTTDSLFQVYEASVATAESKSVSAIRPVDHSEWHVIAARLAGDQIGVSLDGAAFTDAAGITAPFTPDRLRIGGNAAAHPDRNHRGVINWLVTLMRHLTDVERTELAAWDGRVVTEPAWLRAAATLYVNADDPITREFYRDHNYVHNLADGFTGDTTYGDLNLLDAPASSGNLLGGVTVPVLSTDANGWHRVPAETRQQRRWHVDLAKLRANHYYTASIQVRNPGTKPVTVNVDWSDLEFASETIQPGETKTVVAPPTQRHYNSTYRFMDMVIEASGEGALLEFRAPYVEYGKTANRVPNDFTYQWTGNGYESTATRTAPVPASVGLGMPAQAGVLGVVHQATEGETKFARHFIPHNSAAASYRTVMLATGEHGDLASGDQVTLVARVRCRGAISEHEVAPLLQRANYTGGIGVAFDTMRFEPEWTEYRSTVTVATTPHPYAGIYIALPGSSPDGDAWFDFEYLVLVNGEYHGDYFDGDTEGAEWTGLPHASTSVKLLPTEDEYVVRRELLLEKLPEQPVDGALIVPDSVQESGWRFTNALFLEGDGMPEGVVPAPVGSRYIDAQATNGAVEWIKASGAGTTGWQVVYGDTGIRQVNDLVNTATVPDLGGSVYVTRTGNKVALTFGDATAAADVPAEAEIMVIPEGFRPVMSYMPAQAVNISAGGSTFTLRVHPYWSGTPHRLAPMADMNAVRFSMNAEWETRDPWPETLPGTS